MVSSDWGRNLTKRADSCRSTRVAVKLVAQATEAFSHGHEEAGRRLVTRAARIYEQSGEPEVAVELLVERGLTDSAVVIAARTGQHDRAAQLLGTRAPTVVSHRAPTLPAGLASLKVSPARLVSFVSDSSNRDTQKKNPPFSPLIGEAAVEGGAASDHSLLVRENWVQTRARFRDAYIARRGRSPLAQDVEAWVRELTAAEALGADIYALHLRSVVQRFDPQHPAANWVPRQGTDDLAFVDGENKADLTALSGREIAPDGRTLEILGGNEPGLSVSSTSEIDAAISAVVKVNGEASATSAPLDVGPLLALTPSISSAEDLSGTLLRGRFRLEEKVGRGAQAQVYRARDQVLDRELAIKVLSDRHVDNPDALEGFLVEARLAAQVHHPGCLEIFDFGREGDLTFLAMEYFEGRSLRNLLRSGRLELILALHVGHRLAEALEAIHSAGIVHRDIKPSNILVNRKARPKLMDFGVAVQQDADHEEGMMVGTIRYMSPEQARGRPPHPRADIFSLGVVLWEMFAGRPPFEPTVDALKQRMTALPPELPVIENLPPEVKDCIMQCLSNSVVSRPSRAAQVAQVLARSLGKLRRQRLLESAGDVTSPLNKSSVGDFRGR